MNVKENIFLKWHLRAERKFCMRKKVISLILALMLVATMVVPAMAAYGNGTYNNQQYKYMASSSASGESAYFTYANTSASVSCKITANLWCGQHTDYFYREDSDYKNGTAKCSISNYIYEEINGSYMYHTCTFQNGEIFGRVGSTQVVRASY